MNIKIGAHQSIAGGYDEALKRIKNIGGNCLQIFSSSPRGWSFAKVTDEQAKQFASLKNKLKIDPIYFHASYLVNLADEGKIGHLSKMSLIAEMNISTRLDIKGSIVHLGSYKNEATRSKYEKLITNIKEVLEKTPEESIFIMENAGNKKIGQSLEEISKIVSDVNDKRFKVCLDTCHLYSAGYDLSSEEKLQKFLLLFEKLIGLDKLELFHFNDSRDPLSSGRDRHENIGKGSIPKKEFQLLMTNETTKKLAFIIETPGFENKGPDKENLDILKSLL